MSTDSGDSGDSDPTDLDDATYEPATFPEPCAHGGRVSNNLQDFNPENRGKPATERDTLHAAAARYWDKKISNSDKPYIAVEDFSRDWLPDDDYVLLAKSSNWKAGIFTDGGYNPFYEYKLVLRKQAGDDRNERFAEASTALSIDIIPQYEDLVYKSNDSVSYPYGEGTQLRCQTTWAETPIEIEQRMYDAIETVYGPTTFNLEDRVEESRRILRAEAHIRFHKNKKNAAVETAEQSKDLIAWGGRSEIEAHQKRQKNGWLEFVAEADRWDLLGFDPQRYDTELKIYHIADWHKRPENDPLAHPKMEAAYLGVNSGKLLHIDDWDEVMDHLKQIVATHATWSGIERDDLIADNHFNGSLAPTWEYRKPTGRREMLRNRYEDLSTEIYREALKESTTAVYDILKTIADESGATYDVLEQQTGLARSTIRYHVRRLAETGVVKRLGNPVLVVFISKDLLNRAQEILREVEPGDMVEDRIERAEERRERRNENQQSTDDDETLDDEETGESDSTADESNFEYLAKLSADFVDITHQYKQDQLGEWDIRIRSEETDDKQQE